jgi:chromosomal replication initiation ATPase DnaA
VNLIDSWPKWPASVVLLLGPPGSGKSHLVEVWRETSEARRIAGDELSVASIPDLLLGGALAVEDLPGSALDERALFHLINLAKQQDARVMLTAQAGCASWPLALADLISRLKAVPVVELKAPDDELLQGVLLKLFADRQIAVGQPVIAYLLTRMPRSMEAARVIVAAIDRQALEERAEITRPLVARVLSRLTEPGLFGNEGEP